MPAGRPTPGLGPPPCANKRSYSIRMDTFLRSAEQGVDTSRVVVGALVVRAPTAWPAPKDGPHDDAYSGFTHVADRAIAPPRFAPDLSITHGGITTRDPGVSPDRLTPAGHRELVVPTSCGPPFPHNAGTVPAHGDIGKVCLWR